MSLRSLLKSSVPIGFWRSMKAAYRFREGHNAIRSINRAIESGDIARLYLTDDVYVYEPDSSVPAWLFRRHFWESEQRTEMLQFLDLAEGCSRLIDVGASGGVMSAVFAQSRSGALILAIEPDKVSLEVLHDVREKNGAGTNWAISDVAISDAPGVLQLFSYGYGGEFAAIHEVMHKGDAAQSGTLEKYDVTVTTLAECADHHGFVPDIVKIDIESFESEVVQQSLPFFQKHRPRIHLELHNLMIRRRGRDPMKVLSELSGLGYRIYGSDKRPDALDVTGDGPIRVGLYMPA